MPGRDLQLCVALVMAPKVLLDTLYGSLPYLFLCGTCVAHIVLYYGVLVDLLYSLILFIILSLRHTAHFFFISLLDSSISKVLASFDGYFL